MKVLIVGSGGREHAIAWKTAQSRRVDKIYCAPGNAGISQVAECVDIKPMEFEKLVAFAKEKEIDLTVIGMDDPLVGGIVDAFQEAGLRVFGPNKAAAILEGSKAFSKNLMKKYGIPTAAYETFTDPEAALAYLETAKMPIVLKADGLALGKGVLICQDLSEARAGVRELMMDKKFGSAGNEIVVEEFMTGREVSVLSFVDGNTVKIMSSAQDHKRARDGDQGLNTGGMGNYSPSPFYTKEVDAYCQEHIYQPTVDAMKAEGRPLRYDGKWSAPAKDCDANGQGSPFACYMYGLFMAEVAVDITTGKTAVEKLTMIADIGKVNNRLVTDGQLYGGLAQGIGLALTEDYEDIKKHSTLIGAGLPYIKDVPDDIELIYLENSRKDGPFGASGVGELPLTAPHAAIINAIYQACGARVRHLPARPEKVLAALKK